MIVCTLTRDTLEEQLGTLENHVEVTMSQRARNLELAFTWVDAVRRMDIGQLTGLLDPVVGWWAVGQSPDGPPGCSSRKEVLELLRGGFRRHATATVESIELAASDSHALVGRRDPNLVEANFMPVAEQVFLVLTLAQGTITALHSYAKRAEARQAAGLTDTEDWR